MKRASVEDADGTGRMDVRLKRAHEPASGADGHRVLVDRLWPRGVSRERAMLDERERELPPSPELRRWFGPVGLTSGRAIVHQ